MTATALFSDYQNTMSVPSSFTLEMKKENFLNITYAIFFISHTLHTTQTLREQQHPKHKYRSYS